MLCLVLSVYNTTVQKKVTYTGVNKSMVLSIYMIFGQIYTKKSGYKNFRTYLLCKLCNLFYDLRTPEYLMRLNFVATR